MVDTNRHQRGHPEEKRAEESCAAGGSGNCGEHFAPKRYEPWKSNPEQLYGKQEIHQIVEEAIQSLPEIYREAFVLRDVEELSAEEAAEVLGIRVPALKSRLLRARLMMRESLAERLEEQPTLKTKIVHKVMDAGTAVAMRMMRAAGR